VRGGEENARAGEEDVRGGEEERMLTLYIGP
jgi:hypothetical protein